MKQRKRHFLPNTILLLLLLVFTASLQPKAASFSAKAPEPKIRFKENDLVISWKKRADLTGYELYKCNARGKRLKLLKDTHARKVRINNLKSGRTYYYQIRGYRITDEETNYTEYSRLLKVQVYRKSTLKELLLTALQPVGSTMYVWGGGWNEADTGAGPDAVTIGVSALLQGIPSYETSAEITAAIAEFENAKNACVAIDVTTVPHIFYHSLINDTDRAFNVEVLGQSEVDGMNAWMTTVEEFDKITQTMYDNGYVFVRLRDLVVQSVDENGNVSFSPNMNLMLPPDKKPVVLSVDDLSYYHSYEPAGYPDKLVLDENGDVKCHYVTSDGVEHIGDYDVVPRLNTFLAQHPDGAYKGARGLIAMTGYNGVFGYRTDADYELQENLMSDQSDWLSRHPDFNRQTEIAEATKIADALKQEGWEFASHTWGHLSVTNKTVDELRVDNEKWVNNVQNIVGPVDTIIFAHGNDIGNWEDYSSDNEKYQYFKSAGYNFFCNVDGSQPYWVQIRSDYVRQGRIDLDGYMLYQSSLGETTVIDDMFLASQVFDQRRPTPVVANGEE